MLRIKKLIPYIIAVILIVVGIVGYSTKESGSPTRTLFKTKGGNVIFTHKAHLSDYGMACDKCHHKSSKTEYNCRKCHSKGTDYDGLCSKEAIHKQCIGANCVDCHKKFLGKDEKDCKYCHK